MRIRYLLAIMAAMPFLMCVVHWLYAVSVTLIRGRVRKCPRCSSRTRWSKIRLYDRYLPAFVLPRRCESCQQRFYAAHTVNYVQRAREEAAASVAAAAQPRPASAGAWLDAVIAQLSPR